MQFTYTTKRIVGQVIKKIRWYAAINSLWIFSQFSKHFNMVSCHIATFRIPNKCTIKLKMSPLYFQKFSRNPV